jgi:hypothetical protein
MEMVFILKSRFNPSNSISAVIMDNLLDFDFKVLIFGFKSVIRVLVVFQGNFGNTA